MPLSEHEQRLLDEMERNLYQNDAEFVAKVGGARFRPAYRSISFGVALCVIGVGALIAGVLLKMTPLGLAGFALMFAGVLLALTPARRAGGSGAAASRRSGATRGGGKQARGKQGPVRFMDKLGERWDKRQDGQG